MKEKYNLYSNKPKVNKSEVKLIIDEYNEGIKNNEYQRYKHIVEMIPRKIGKVLDYGCGWGCISKAIAEKDNDVIGIDQSEGAIEIARDFNKHKNVNYYTKKINDFENETFDIVNSNQVLEHVHNPGIYLSSVNRVLKNGGYLVISVPNIINLYSLFVQLRKNLDGLFYDTSIDVLENYSKVSDHIQSWEPITFIKLHASLGFQYIEHKFLEGVLLPWGKYEHTKIPWKGRYFHTKKKRIKNLTYTMLFKFKKIKYVDIRPED